MAHVSTAIESSPETNLEVPALHPRSQVDRRSNYVEHRADHETRIGRHVTVQVHNRRERRVRLDKLGHVLGLPRSVENNIELFEVVEHVTLARGVIDDDVCA